MAEWSSRERGGTRDMAQRPLVWEHGCTFLLSRDSRVMFNSLELGKANTLAAA